MLDAADVEVDGEPRLRRLGSEGQARLVGRAVAEKVPRGIDKGVHRVGLAASRAVALRTGRFDEAFVVLEGRALLPRQHDVEGKLDRKVALGDADDAARLAVDDGDGRPPVALAGDAPVAETEDRAPAAETFVFGVPAHFFGGLRGREPREDPRVDEDAVIFEDLAGLGVE